MAMIEENDRLECLARIEIAKRMRAMDPVFVRMEFWESDVRKMLKDYAKGEGIAKTTHYRIARDFIAKCKNGDELMRKYGPKRRG